MKHRRRTISKHNRRNLPVTRDAEAIVASSEAGKAVTESLGGGLDYSSALTSKRSRAQHASPNRSRPDAGEGAWQDGQVIRCLPVATFAEHDSDNR
jgi:hypothetical protein